MKRAPHKVLLDLFLALGGYHGIPQDTRLTFKSILKCDNIHAAGLMFACSARALKCAMNDTASRTDSIRNQTEFLAAAINGDHGYSHITPLRRIQKLRDMRLLNKMRDFSLHQLDSKFFSGLIWRKLFSHSLAHDDYDLLTSQNYYMSQLNFKSMVNAIHKNYEIKLNTDAWDFVIFQDARPVSVSENTTKIVRYHDSTPISDLDCFIDGTGIFHCQALQRCKKDSFFVCNSEPTRELLVSFIPQLEGRSTAIPCVLNTNYKKSVDKNVLKNIFVKRLSGLSMNARNRSIRSEKISNEPEFSYILALSTLEPRKNYISLIRAWEMLRNKKGIKHKLVIVANKGWKYEEIKNAMKPGIESGDIIHLEKIPPEEIPYLYSHASAFVYPSYNEGFGFPPMEAMQCECPVVVSDIKPHRWVMGEAALYCNPYSVDSIADAIGQLIASENAEGLRQDLIAKGLKRIQKFHPDVISQQWQDLFDTLKAKPLIQNSSLR